MSGSLANVHNTQITFWTNLPKELKCFILNIKADEIISAVVNKEVFLNDDIKKAGRDLKALSLTCKFFNESLKEKYTQIELFFNKNQKGIVFLGVIRKSSPNANKHS